MQFFARDTILVYDLMVNVENVFYTRVHLITYTKMTIVSDKSNGVDEPLEDKRVDYVKSRSDYVRISELLDFVLFAKCDRLG